MNRIEYSWSRGQHYVVGPVIVINWMDINYPTGEAPPIEERVYKHWIGVRDGLLHGGESGTTLGRRTI